MSNSEPNGVPDHIPTESTDPNAALPVAVHDAPDSGLKRVAERIDWLKVIAVAAVGIFGAGVAGAGVLSKVMTRDDYERAEAKRIEAAKAAPPDPRLVQRIDATDAKLGEHIARHEGDVDWIKESLRLLMRERRIDPPLEHSTITPPR